MSTRQFPIHRISATQPSGVILGDEWYNPTTSKLYKFLALPSGTPDWTEILVGNPISGSSTQATATQLASGPSSQRPSSPSTGMMRFNTDFNCVELFMNNTWILVSTGAPSATNNYTVNYLVVAGGGGGGAGVAGSANGGGAGAGGLLQGTVQINIGTTYTVTIGAGGANGLQGSNSAITTTNGFANITAVGGGGGCSSTTGTTGGSGGGGGSSSFPTGLAGTYGQGYAGGTSVSLGPSFGAAGGGGAAGAGGAGTTATGGNGGQGLPSAISGILTYYAGGGGGSSTGAYPIGQGGAGGGGRGGTGASPTIPNAGAAGSTNTGGGGGGSNSVSGTVLGPSGGSGIIIISYANPKPRSTSGTITSYISNNTVFWVHTFLSSSTYVA